MTKTAACPDTISHRHLKETTKTICKPLWVLFNRSIQDGIYPDGWKTASVVSLFKKRDSELSSNYMPISLISCVGKVVEHVMFKNI